MVRTVKRLFNYFLEGFYTQRNNEESLKIYLIYSFSIVGFIFIFSFGLKGIHTSNIILTSLLLGGSTLLLFNLFYLKKTKNHNNAGNIVLYFFLILMLYLVYSGGVENTGPLWIYCLPPVALYIHGFKRGLFDLSLFVLFLILILFNPYEVLLNTDYSFAYKIRIVLSFLLVTLLSAVYGYSREKASKKMVEMKNDLEFFLRRDELTGLYNRRGYTDNLHKIHNTQGVILMCDLDHFKNVNDTYGHVVGDFVIKEVAKRISYTLRKEDLAVRWGGEEFFIFLANITIEDAYKVSEKLRSTIENFTMNYSENIAILITMSIGIAGVNKKNSLEDSIRNADDAMYLSKAKGRNRTTIYGVGN